MENHRKRYENLLVLLETANGRKETIGLLHETAKIYSKLNNK